mgnify:CR=1 FL=1
MIKNAFAYVTRKSLKSIIILLVIMAMSTLSLISLAIKDATNRASEETFKNITNSFSMEINRRVNLGTPRGGGNIKGKDINKIAESNDISSFVKRINSVADLIDNDIVETKETIANQSPERAENFKRTVMLTGVNDSSKENKFISGAYKLSSGEHLNENDKNKILMHKDLAEKNNLKIGDKYSDLRKTISIIILDDVFKLTKNLEKPQTTWKIRENEELHLILTDYFEIIIIELPKVVKAYHKTPNDEVLQWMLFLDNPEKEEVSRIMEENKDIKEAKEELDRISQDDLLRRRVLNRTLEIADKLQMKKELEEARKELEEAKKEAQQAENKKEDIIKNLHKLNIPIEQISKAVNLSEKEIKEILSTHS